jgi:hypothetical protein
LELDFKDMIEHNQVESHKKPDVFFDLSGEKVYVSFKDHRKNSTKTAGNLLHNFDKPQSHKIQTELLKSLIRNHISK